ncbi:MFS transporter [Nonomuraea diastatica]|uniref:MFS transporter n=2 Tax=Nonomuraea diastatica TaxID=1848329 RepID=A0A4R4WSD7_9ACTN|nr:MFS transporter [Nonomuraea diastatica]
MVVLDVSVVNVALPSIQDALAFDPPDLAWVGNAYALVFGGFLLLGGRLADLYGRRRVFAAGLALFTAASLMGGLSTSGGTLIAARAAQGLGAAVLAPVTLTIVTTTFPEGPLRTRAIAVWTAVSLAGGAAGSLIGGALTEYLSWRSILLVNVPIGLVCLAAIRFLGPDAARRGGQRVDLLGAALATSGTVALAYGLGGPPAFTLAGVILAGLFVVVETRLARAPLIPPRLVRPRAIWLGNLAMLLAGACLNPMWYFLTLSMQRVLDYGPLQTGLAFLPHTLLTMLVGLYLTPWLMRRANDRVLVVAGALIGVAGFLWQAAIAPGDSYLTAILGPAILISLGGGLLNTPLTVTVTSGVDSADAGAASGLMNTAKQVGGGLGLAAVIALTGEPSGGREATAQALAAGYGQAFALIAVVMAVVAVLAGALPARRDNAVTDADEAADGQRVN